MWVVFVFMVVNAKRSRVCEANALTHLPWSRDLVRLRKSPYKWPFRGGFCSADTHWWLRPCKTTPKFLQWKCAYGNS